MNEDKINSSFLRLKIAPILENNNINAIHQIVLIKYELNRIGFNIE